MKIKSIRVFFTLIIIVGLIVFIFELFGISDEIKKIFIYPRHLNEYFDPSLLRLKSVSQITAYCDTLYGSNRIAISDSEKYAAIVSRTLRDRFYHGYSYYSLGQNTLGYILAPLIDSRLDAIVIPDDILKHPMAACSQQSIVGMEIFKRKGFAVRGVGFNIDGLGGHFCYEAYFNDKWHFFDPDLEPKLSIMINKHFPGIAEIAKDDSLLHSLYYKLSYNDVKKLFPTYTYGPVNKFPAPHAIIYQYVTKYLSYCSWLIFLFIYFFINKKLVRSMKNKKLSGSHNSLLAEQRA